MKRNRSRDVLRRLVIVALFTALAYVVMLMIHFPISFLTMDVKDAIITLCGLSFGPLSALFISVVVPFLELIGGSPTGLYGFAMNVLGSATFSVTVSLIYKYKKSFLGAIVGLVSGVFALTAVMLLFNLIVTPRYLMVSVGEVAKLIPTLLLPFNLVKAVLNAAIVFFLYKPVSAMLQRSGFLPRSESKFRFDRRMLIVMGVALVLIVVSFAVIFGVLGGRFEFGIS